MRVHYLQHVPFEGPANVRAWAADRGHDLTGTRLDRGESLPDLDGVDWLVVLGGPMGVHDVEEYPWLADEREFVADAVASGGVVIGVCLGAQLVAAALGASVYEHDHREVGWFPVTATDDAARLPGFSALPETYTPFHWHGDTFDLPDGTVSAASSAGCANQAFVYDDRVFGLQFHLETTPAAVEDLVESGVPDDGPYVQAPDELRADADRFAALEGRFYDFLDAVARECGARPPGSRRDAE